MTTIPGSTRSELHVSLSDDETRVTLEVSGPGQLPTVTTVDTAELLEALGYTDTTVTVEESDEVSAESLYRKFDEDHGDPTVEVGGVYRVKDDPRWARRPGDFVPCTIVPDLPGRVVRVVNAEWPGDDNAIVETGDDDRQVIHPDYLEPVGEPRVGDRVRVTNPRYRDTWGQGTGEVVKVFDVIANYRSYHVKHHQGLGAFDADELTVVP